MTQMKWENKLKETLEKRTIEPSKASWDALSDKLDVVEQRKHKSLFLWLGYAASVVAILFTINVMFNSKGAEIPKSVVVDSKEHHEKQLPIRTSPQKDQVAGTQQDVERHESVAKQVIKEKGTTDRNVLTAPTKEDRMVAENENQPSLKPLEKILGKDALEDVKVTEILAQIESLSSTGSTVTEAEIDALLLKAQKEITFQTILNESTMTVDAKSMLQDVEADLQQTLRNKIFKALENGYETVKVALAERNN